jgi:hypothetical protein
MDFGNILSNSGINLEQQAYSAFGTAISDFSGGPGSVGSQVAGILGGGGGLSGLLGGGGSGSSDYGGGSSSGRGPLANEGYRPLPGSIGEWNTSPYAMDLINYAPKHRFLFKVIFDTYDNQTFSNLFSNGRNDFQYIIRHIDKPTISFEYEDVNYYNFRTKVLKFIRHDALSMTVIDDINNNFYDFFRGYIHAHSPISRTWNASESYAAMKRNGFAFSGGSSNAPDSAIRGLLANNNVNILKSIRLFQYFAHGTKMNEFKFINPRIIDFNFEETNHEGNDQGNHCTIRFDYDSLVMAPTQPTQGAPAYPATMTDIFVDGQGLSPFSGGISSLTGGLGSLGGGLNFLAGGLGMGSVNSLVQKGFNTLGSGISSAAKGIYGMTQGESPSSFNTSGGGITDEFGQKWV